MAWPQTVDYNAAVQNPADCFSDPELAAGQAAEGMIPGIPLSYAGNFATVYKILCPDGQVWAVKCFTRQVDNLQQRYQQISEHLQRHRPRFTVDFQYQPEGVRVAGVWRPAVKMQWVEGLTLNEFLRDRVGNAALLERLCQLWLRLGNEMREADMAHGDLQHGNVMLIPGSNASSMLLRLVDYDGMWVPSLEATPPGEVGHANYQHPQRLRQGGYSSDIDRFSHLAIYTALRCLMVGGKMLWTAHDNEENVLFREADFKNPAGSKLFARLLTLPDAGVVALVGRLLLASQAPLEQTPPVNDLLGGPPLAPEEINCIRELVPLVRPATVSASSPPRPLPTTGGRRSKLRPASSPELDDLPEADTAPLEVPQLTATFLDAPRLAPVEEIELPPLLRAVPIPLEVAPAAVPPPLPAKSADEKTLPGAGISWAVLLKLPPPEWLLRMGLGQDSLPGRLWPITLAFLLAAPLLLLLLVVWGLWPGGKTLPSPPPDVAAKAQLRLPDRIDLRAGHTREVALTVERSTTEGELSIALPVLPEGLSCPPERLAAGAGPGEVRLRLSAAATADRFTGEVVVRLVRGKEILDEKRLGLTVAPFNPPRLITDPPLSAIQLEPGKTRLVLARVKPEGNTDPWTLRLDPLPKGVSQRPPRAAVSKGMAGVELTAQTDAPEQEGLIAVVSLLADGVPADSTNVSLSVKKTVSATAISLKLPPAIRVQAGDKTSFTVAVQRSNGYAGPVKLEVEDLPAGVRATEATVAEGANSAEIELKADEAAAPRLELQRFRVVASVDGKPVGSQDGTFLLMRGLPPPVKLVVRVPDAEGVVFQAPDGVQLRGTFYPSPEGVKGPCVLMIPEPGKGFSCKDDAWVQLAKKLQMQGCAVLTFDFRGFGETLKAKDAPAFNFWNFPANKLLLASLKKQGIVRLKPPIDLNGEQFPSVYMPWLVQDIVGVRHYLDTAHDNKTVNSQNLIVIAAGEGATLATFWLAGECRRRSTTSAEFESRDVIGAAWIDMPRTLGKRDVTRPLNILEREFKAAKTLPPMVFVHRTAGSARFLAGLLKQPYPAVEKTVAGAGGKGQALLSDPAAEKVVLDHVAALLKKHPLRPWSARNVRQNAYFWNLGNQIQWAKMGFGPAPMPLPLNLLGFPNLPAFSNVPGFPKLR